MTPERSSLDPKEDLELASRAASGDHKALASLYERHREALRNALRNRLGTSFRRHADSEDVLQSAFAHALADFSAAAPRESALFPWVAKIVERTLLDRVRYLRRERRDVTRNRSLSTAEGEAARDVQASRIISKREDAARVESVLATLSERDQLLIRLAKHEGLTTAQIGGRLGMTREAAKRAVTRALARLAQALVNK